MDFYQNQSSTLRIQKGLSYFLPLKKDNIIYYVGEGIFTRGEEIQFETHLIPRKMVTARCEGGYELLDGKKKYYLRIIEVASS
jgi:hypothetical protein